MGLKKLFKWLKPSIGLVILAVILTIINPLTYSYVPQFIKYVVDIILKETQGASITLPPFLLDFFASFTDKIKAITVVGLTLVLFQLIRGLLMFSSGYVKGRVGENITYDIRLKMYNHLQNLSYEYNNNADCGDLIQRCTSDIEQIRTFLSNDLPEIIYIISSIVFAAIQINNINTTIMLVTLIIAPITCTFSIIYFKYVTKKFEKIEESEAAMTSVLQENVNGVRVVKAFNVERDEINKFEEKNLKYKNDSLKLNKGMAAYWSLSDMITFTQYAITVFVCILFAKKAMVSTGDIIVCMMYIGMLVWPVRNMGRIIANFGKAMVASKRIDEVLSEVDEYQINGTKTPVINGNIEFKNVGFSFKDSQNPILKNINFKIKKGQSIAIVGATGSGKSTIANLLVRLLEITEGDIIIDGVSIKEIEKHYLRKNIGIVLQDPFLFNDTIYKNVEIAAINKKPDDVYKACQVASIHEDILGFEKGYDTFVGEKGVTLSGGQRQRIAISRMILDKKPIIIFDDSLSAVDTKTDLEIRSRLKEANSDLTTILITHRITSAKECDQIIVLNHNTIEAIGNHEELSKIPGVYKSLWDIQGNLENEFASLIEDEKNFKKGAK